MEIMATSFKKSHVCPSALSAPSPVAVHRRLTPLPETPGHSQQVWVSLLRGCCSFLMGPGAQGSVCALQESAFLVLWKFCNQIPLASEVKFSVGSQSLCQIPGLGNLFWALELS